MNILQIFPTIVSYTKNFLNETEINLLLKMIEDAKTEKAVLFLMIQEIVTSTPNDQELGKRIRKIINNYKLNTID